jgi:hypothetical protein
MHFVSPLSTARQLIILYNSDIFKLTMLYGFILLTATLFRMRLLSSCYSTKLSAASPFGQLRWKYHPLSLWGFEPTGRPGTTKCLESRACVYIERARIHNGNAKQSKRTALFQFLVSIVLSKTAQSLGSTLLLRKTRRHLRDPEWPRHRALVTGKTVYTNTQMICVSI